MTVDLALLTEALELTARDRATRRTEVEEDILLDRFVAEFVAESESLEGHETSTAEVLTSARDLAL